MCGIPWQTYQLSRCIVETCRRANKSSLGPLRRRSTSVGNWNYTNYTSCSIYVKMSQKLPTSLLTFNILSEAFEKKKDNQQLFQIFPIHPRKPTWNLKITCLKRKIIFQSSIFGFHVSFRGSIPREETTTKTRMKSTNATNTPDVSPPWHAKPDVLPPLLRNPGAGMEILYTSDGMIHVRISFKCLNSIEILSSEITEKNNSSLWIFWLPSSFLEFQNTRKPPNLESTNCLRESTTAHPAPPSSSCRPHQAQHCPQLFSHSWLTP